MTLFRSCGPQHSKVLYKHVWKSEREPQHPWSAQGTLMLESPTSLSKHTMLQSEKQKNDSSRKEFNKDAYKILEELEEQSIESPPHHRILSRKPRKAVIMLISNNRDPEHCLPLLYFFDQSYYLKGFFHTTHHSFLMNSS